MSSPKDKSVSLLQIDAPSIMAHRPSTSKYENLDAAEVVLDDTHVGLIVGPVGGKGNPIRLPQLPDSENTFVLKSVQRFYDECNLLYRVHKSECEYFFRDLSEPLDPEKFPSAAAIEDCAKCIAQEYGQISKQELGPERKSAVRKPVICSRHFAEDGRISVTFCPVETMGDRFRNSFKKHFSKMKSLFKKKEKKYKWKAHLSFEENFRNEYPNTLGRFQVVLLCFSMELTELGIGLETNAIKEFKGGKDSVWYCDLRTKDDHKKSYLYLLLDDKESINHHLIVTEEVSNRVRSLVASAKTLIEKSYNLETYWKSKENCDEDLLARIRSRAKNNFKIEFPHYWE